jgi:bifunctional UDP-N-acetylglucosamine pyrophosphorylase/glucosamine-1-phosphate N-acetyltransferase
MGLNVIVLAAGEGRRMRSRGPKVLVDLAGRTLLQHVLDGAAVLGADRVRVVVGHGADAVRAAVPDPVETVLQPEQRGTGDAVASALGGLNANDTTLVLYGDVPLPQRSTLEALVDAARRTDLSILTVDLDDPSGYGRIVRGADGHVSRIVEDRDAGPEERALTEINTGLLAMRTGPLARHVAALDRDNAQGEYYLTDVIGRVSDAGGSIAAVQPNHEWEVRGVNSRAQLAALERTWQQWLAEELMASGVSLRDPARIEIRGRLQAEPDTTIDVGCVFEGDVRLGAGVRIGAHCVLRDTTVGDDAVIEPHSVLQGAEIGRACSVGPFARLRPGSRLREAAKIGNFVETKNTDLGAGSKINHLSYVGDTEVGPKSNIGAGVITCNYDGHRKHRTVIGERAFIGSDCQLVAPVTVGNGATIGAGTTLTSDAPAEKLTVGRTHQRTIEGWVRPAERDTESGDGGAKE